MSARPRIGLMCKAPRPGFAKTRLAAALGRRRAAELARAFLADSARLAAGLGPLTAFHAPADAAQEIAPLLPPGTALVPQAEGDLGARLIAAFAELLAQGSPALVMGTDSPDLPPALLGEALAALASHDAAIIPAEDGGYCAIALAAPQPQLFRGIPWSSPQTLAATLAAGQGLRVHLTAPWHDVDEAEDLARLDLSAAPATRAVLYAGRGPRTGG
ncbi:MAG: TIGR04282 family arsenosugar biosynthesis glycosyltransferase [Rhodovarius sp.]|nr:TIGR04282 family arsenosugar biosynthesis glycosyltransferase [Rhodovarius sp.]